jgi:prolyl oligopeptidase
VSHPGDHDVPLRYPEARRDPVIEASHGYLIADPYRWLEESDAEATRRWLREQQALTAGYLAGLPGQGRLCRMLRDLTPRPPRSPVKIAASRRFRAGAFGEDERWTLQVQEGDEATAGWRTVVAATDLHPDAAVGTWQPSPTGSLVAVQVLVAGAEDQTPLSLVDVATGRIVETVSRTRYSPIEWRADERAFFYTRGHLDRPGTGVYHHDVGGDVTADRLVIGDETATTRYHVMLWHDRWLVVTVRDGTARDTRVSVADIRAGSPLRPLPLEAGPSAVMVDDEDRLLASVAASGGFGQVLVADRVDDGWGPWRVLLPEDPSGALEGVTLTHTERGSRLITSRSRDGISRMTVHDATTGAALTEVGLPGDGTVGWVRPTDDPAVLALTYAGWATPPSIWHLDVHSGRVTPYDEEPARVDIGISRHVYHSADGTEVPLTILAPPATCGRDRDGPRPTLLAVYGGFGIPARPAYQRDLLSWVLNGGYAAIAGVRGGGERGRRWHQEGSGANKGNALADLHAAGDWLVRHAWTRRDQLALFGGSNGGLLVMAAAVQRPDAYAVVACARAPLDMIRYDRWGLGRAWREEYGSPGDKADLETLLSYSPYHNVAAGRRHPAVLLMTGGNDTRVDPLHSRKMAAQLQYATTGGPVLHYVMEGSGHTGARGELGTRHTASTFAFIARHAGLTLVDDV